MKTGNAVNERKTKYGIFAWFGYEMPLRERLRLIGEAGFDSVMLWWGDEMSGTDGKKTAHPDLARSFGLYVENVHAPYFGINGLWDGGADGEREEKLLLRCLEECASCGVPTMVMHITDGPAPPPFSSQGLDRIERLIARAGDLGVTLALENVQRPEYLERVFSSVCDKGQVPRGLGFCYDSGHDFAVSHSNGLIDKYAPLLSALHLHDNDGSGDMHLLPHEGAIDWNRLGERILASGYTGPVTLESCAPWHEGIKQQDRESPQEYLARALKAAESILR